MLDNLWIVITSINEPSSAIKKYLELASKFDFSVLIVGDTITPDTYRELDCHYLSIEDQNNFLPSLSNLIPTRHYCRKNIGYLYAISHGAEFIFDTDDDNIPLDNFVEMLVNANSNKVISSKSGFCNIYSQFSSETVWPRGLPLDEIKYDAYCIVESELYRSPIIQFLADREPDVDAVFRLVDNKQIYFEKDKGGLSLEPGTWCPFNSQATLFDKLMFPYLYLPCHVPFRMTDIWRSFVAQIGLWKKNETLSFYPPIVEQFRNEHDYFDDFLDEIQGYKFNKRICNKLAELDSKAIEDHESILNSYRAMEKIGVINQREFLIIKEWSKTLVDYN